MDAVERADARGATRGRRGTVRRGSGETPAQLGAAGCPKGSWPSNTAGAPYRARLPRSRRTRSRTPSAPRHPGSRQGTGRSAQPRAGPAPALKPPICAREHVPRDMSLAHPGHPRGHVLRDMSLAHRAILADMSSRTRPILADMSSETGLSRTQVRSPRALRPDTPAPPMRAPRVGGVRLSAAPTVRSFSASLGAGGPKGVWTESGGTDEVGRDTVRPPCLRAKPPSDTRLRPVARAPKPDPAGPRDVVRVAHPQALADPV